MRKKFSFYFLQMLGVKLAHFLRKWLSFEKYILHVQSQFLMKFFFSFCSLFLDLDQKLDYRKRSECLWKFFCTCSEEFWEKKNILFKVIWFICSSVLSGTVGFLKRIWALLQKLYSTCRKSFWRKVVCFNKHLSYYKISGGDWKNFA